MPSATFLHGVRTPWSAVPAALRDRLLARTGPLVAEPEDRTGGMATGLAVVLHGRRGSFFAKAIDAVENPVGAQMYRRESEVADALPAHPTVPALVGAEQVDLPDGGRWWVNLLEARPGEPVTHPWSGRDLDRVLTAWCDLRTRLRATPWSGSAGLSELLTGWRRIAEDPDDDWHRLALRWRDREAAMAAVVDGGADGRSGVLSHIDLRADNILVTGPGDDPHTGDHGAVDHGSDDHRGDDHGADDHRGDDHGRDDHRGDDHGGAGREGVTFVDWAHPGLAAPWADVAILLADVVGSGAAVECGGTIDVVDAFCRCEPGTDPELAVGLITGLGAFLHLRAVREPVNPLMPHRHTWSAAQSEQLGRFAEVHTR
ncbi:hypothetical protein FHX74_000197 [Friedmanniella endophytica]|uniref:Phosphotransferase enzyme family protein n=1 Tax=Microlunatus kandeliicorticis TaxID=1759536 RepID=A0A7W3IP09_9ACTN|nr:phosphotransferase [Microlunatus kandeliicorticis]MBA8792603.1 hypothetical protein [Microlunatus kandeliicorticis]